MSAGAAEGFYQGASTLTKPTVGVANGSLWAETDTGYLWMFNASSSSWVRKTPQIYHTIPQANPAAITSTTGKMAGLQLGSTTVNANSAAGQNVLGVTATTNFFVGEWVAIYGTSQARSELQMIASIQSGTSLTFVNPLLNTHTSAQGDTVVGLYAALVPVTGRVFVEVSGVLVGGAAATDTVQLTYGILSATAPPANATAVASGGTLCGNVFTFTGTSGNLSQGFFCTVVFGSPNGTGTAPSGPAALAIGVPIWFDLALTGSTSTTQATNLIITIYEL